MTTKISSDNIQDATLATIGSGPKITQVLVCDSSYNELDDTAVDTAGGYVKIVGSGFKTGATVTINRQQAVSVTFVNSTELRAQVPAEVAGTYVVYVVNSDGGVALRVNGVTFSSLPAWTTDSTLPTSNSDALISIQLVAAQATQYTLAQGSTLPPDLTLSNSGLLSGTVSISTETTYNFQVVATDAELQDSPRSFSITITVGDPFFTSVTVLVNTSGTNGAQNNTFIDSSTNNFTITRNGNTTQGSFSPFGENWSNFFPGSGDVSLRVPDSDAFWFDTQDFTLETWVFLSAKQSFNIFQQSNGSSGNVLKWAWWFNNSTNSLVLNGHNPATSPLTWATRAWTPVVGKWYHLAVSKQSNSFRMFVDGAELGTANTVTTALPQVTSELYISAFKDAPVSAPRELAGYFSNMRIVKGTAVYTSNFTPSTVPLQPVAGTSLLTCRDPNIVDDSANQFTITQNGTVTVQKFGPFAGTTLPTPYYGAYFDGSGDVLTLGSNAALAFATGDFTLEMWYYTTVTPTATNVCLYNNGSGNFFLQIRNTAFGIGVVGSTENNAFSFNFVAGQWYHVAVAREGSTVRGFVDGTLVGTGSNSINYGQNGATIGGLTSSSQLITGHLSNLRVVKGQALYTSGFTPSTVPLTTTSQGATAGNVSLLTCQSSTFIDNSPNNFAITAVGNSRPTTFAPFAVTYSLPQSYTPEVFGGSAYFDGAGDYLQIAANTIFDFGSDNFTIECWAYPLTSGVQTGLIANWQTGGQFIVRKNSSNRPTFVYDPVGAGAVTVTGTTTTIVTGSWNHVAVVRNNNVYTMYVNGIPDATTSTNAAALEVLGRPLRIGSDADASGLFTGYISGTRIVKGTALYTSSFVPQNAPPAPVTNTTLLLNATNAGIYDASTLNDFETVGNAQVSTSVKKYGTSSMAFDGTGDYLITSSAVANPVLALGTGAFTIEFWFYANSNSGTQQLFDTRPAGVTSTSRYMAITYLSGSLNYYTAGGSPSIAGGVVAPGAWNYVTLTRSGTSTRLFINGVQVGSTITDSQDYLIGINRPIIGADGANPATANFAGYIQDLRITRGIARYTTNFTPPTAALQTR